ncbi:MAG: AIR carboxylase family protein [archaeon]
MIVILMGSVKDMAFCKKIGSLLDEFRMRYEFKVASAHKTPELVLDVIKESEKKYADLVFITVAGRSNGLSGVVAANTVKPVIACPPIEDNAAYLVDIHSSLRMPSGTPSMTVLGPENAALAAVKIIALTDEKLSKKVDEDIRKTKENIKKTVL